MQSMMDNSSIVQMLLDAVILHRFDLTMFVAGLLGYFVLLSSRDAKAAKGFHKKVATTIDEDPEDIDTDFVAEASPALCLEAGDMDSQTDAAGSCLAQILASMEDLNVEVHFASAMLDAFLEDYPLHPFTLAEVQTVLSYCRNPQADKYVANRLLERMAPTEDWTVLSAFIRFFLDNEQCEEACNIFELNYATFFDMELDQDMEWPLLMAASKCGRQSLADHLLQTSHSDAATHVKIIQNWWRRASVQVAETRVSHMGDVLHRLSNMFNERYPFEEHSDDESTCFLGDDSDCESESDADSTWEAVC